MKKISLILSIILIITLLAGCAGTPVVYYSDCTCPAGSHISTPTAPVGEGAVKTGLAIVPSLSGDYASGDAEGKVKYDVTLVAVNVDENGVITACRIDSLDTSATFGADGGITSDINAQLQTKYEKGDSYGMAANSNAVAEWYVQADALANYAVGKTLEELRTGAVDETGHAADADLATSATIYLAGYVSAIEAAVGNARHLGAQAGDTLKLASVSTLSASVPGTVQLDCTAVALTLNGDTITSCCIDSLQSKVDVSSAEGFDAALKADILTKNQLGYNYHMKDWGSATFEWFEQAENFCAYVTGKTPAEVAGISVSEADKPADGTDLAASVTISIADFLELIAKAAR